MATQRKHGDFIQADFFSNVGGLNNSDSPFKVKDNQAVLGANYDYTQTGSFKKRHGNTQLNSSADAVLPSTGLFAHNTNAGVKTLLRATSSKLQTINTSTGASTNVADDTVSASTTAFTSTQPVVFSGFSTASINSTWMAGGGAGTGKILGYNGTNFTVNGASPFAGALTAASGGAGGTTLSTGNYYYAVVAYKASTAANSNAALDVLYAATAGEYTDLQLSGITAYDTTKYTQIWIYRSAVAGSTAFTTGDLVAKIAYNGTTYTVASGAGSIVSTSKYRDTGSYLSTAANVPRAGNTLLDNSIIDSTGTFNVLTTYKRRLVSATGSTLSFSDVNKPESWPTANIITIPSGGNITALGIISFSTPTTTATDEFLVVFKEKELWIITGTTFGASGDIALKFIDAVGCVAQPAFVLANGFAYWTDYRGFYLWDGSGKPIYISVPIESDFTVDGDFDLTAWSKVVGVFSRRTNQVIWAVPSKAYGAQKLLCKLDLRLSLPGVSTALSGRILEGVWIKDTLSYNVYAQHSTLISSDEVHYAAGNDGLIWKMYDNINSDNGTAISFTYRTRPEDFGLTNSTKRYHKVIVWCKENSTSNLSLKFWNGYKALAADATTRVEAIAQHVTSATWDQATWDFADWDAIHNTYNPVVFNLDAEGEALILEFRQTEVNVPLTIAGYSVLYSIAGLRE